MKIIARRQPVVFLIAGEPSGDAIGARLMTAIRREHSAGTGIEFLGIGGRKMAAAGLQPLFSIDELSVMGFAELLPALPRLVRRFWQTTAAIRAAKPDVVVGIDSKAFCLRVLGALAADRQRPALVQYVAPSAWAFADAPSRAAKLAGNVDELFTLLPFEAGLFEAAGVPCTFVGHPTNDDDDDDDGIMDAGFTPAPSTGSSALCLLPGSRRQEVNSNLPHMLRASEGLLAEPLGAGLSRVLLPAPASLRPLIEAHLRASPVGVEVCSSEHRYAAYRASRLALACSGTVNLELARARVPQVAVYASTRLTSAIVRHILRPTVPFATLPNILNHRRRSGREVWEAGARRDGGRDAEITGRIPELLFEECTARGILAAATPLLTDANVAAAQVEASARALEDLVAARDDEGRAVPSATLAARALLKYL